MLCRAQRGGVRGPRTQPRGRARPRAAAPASALAASASSSSARRRAALAAAAAAAALALACAPAAHAAEDECPLPANVSVAELAEALREGTVRAVVDVRTRSEYLGVGVDTQRDGIGRVPGAVLVDSLATDPAQEARLRTCKSSDSGDAERPRKTLAVICRTGVRSLVATKQLQAKGYPCVANVMGGTLAWAEDGFDVERGLPEGGLPQAGEPVCAAGSAAEARPTRSGVPSGADGGTASWSAPARAPRSESSAVLGVLAALWLAT